MRLMITEKYNTAAPFAKAVGANGRQHVQHAKGNVGWLEGNGWIVTWCAGHLVQTALFDAYDEKYKHWRIEDLPLIPDKLKRVPSTRDPAKTQLRAIRQIFKDYDITEVWNAGDADREGELIVRELLDYLGKGDLLTMRLWYNNVTPASVKKALANPQPASDYDGLYHAAETRQWLDWVYGLNQTRALTCWANETENTGRVVSVAEWLIVDRQRQIDEFVPEHYVNVTARCDITGRGELDLVCRFDDLEEGKAFARSAKGKDVTVTSVEVSNESERRKLYTLTALQSDASKYYGYDAKKTTSIVQRLYEHGWMSYPRTNSDSIMPEQVGEVAPELPECVARVFAGGHGLDTSLLDVQRLVEKSSDASAEASHTGLIPTMDGIRAYQSQIKNDDEGRSIFVLVSMRMIAAALPPALYERTKVSADIDGHEFKASGRATRDAGFVPFEQWVFSGLPIKKRRKKSADAVIPSGIAKGDRGNVVSAKASEKQTKPPEPYTEASLLAAMENAYTMLPDKEMRDLFRKNKIGIGTQASRDSILPTIIKNELATKERGKLHPTDKAKELIGLLPDSLKTPVMTGTMELRLNAIAADEGDEQKLRDGVRKLVTREVDRIHKLPPRKNAPKRGNLGKVIAKGACPCCGADVAEAAKGKLFACADDCGWKMWREVAHKRLTNQQVKEILTEGVTREKVTGMKSKAGREFEAWLVIDEDRGCKFDFSDRRPKPPSWFGKGRTDPK